jgi:hypothetical protein
MPPKRVAIGKRKKMQGTKQVLLLGSRARRRLAKAALLNLEDLPQPAHHPARRRVRSSLTVRVWAMSRTAP